MGCWRWTGRAGAAERGSHCGEQQQDKEVEAAEANCIQPEWRLIARAKKARRRRGKKPAPGKENVAPKDVAPAGPVDVAAVLKARAAAKKKGSKPVSAAAQAALANAKARPATKKKAPKGRQVADPGCNGY